MRRRDIVLPIAAAAVLRPLIARAQQPGRVYRLGDLAAGAPGNPLQRAFRDELHRAGYLEWHNLVIEQQAFVRPRRALELARAMIRGGADALWTAGAPLTRAAQRATRTLPILAVADDLVGSGLVHSLARPGCNTTGISILATELDGKRQQLLLEVVPGARHIAALADPGVVVQGHLCALTQAAQAGGIVLSIYRVARAEEIGPAIDAARAAGAEALNVLASPFLHANQRLIRERAAALKLPAIYQWPGMAEVGGLVAYGPRFAEIGRMSARQLIKVWRGANPADLPVEQPDTFALVVNLKTAKALGFTVPPEIIERADEVIQ